MTAISLRHRRSIRLQGYNYAQAAAYFITICTQNRERFFGEIVGDDINGAVNGVGADLFRAGA